MKLTERHGGSALASRRIRHGRPIASELSVLILAIMVVYGVAAVALVIVKVEQAEDATRELAKFRAELAAGEIADAVEVATTTIGDSAASPGALAALASPPPTTVLRNLHSPRSSRPGWTLSPLPVGRSVHPLMRRAHAIRVIPRGSTMTPA